jgi:hypothetical protein
LPLLCDTLSLSQIYFFSHIYYFITDICVVLNEFDRRMDL